MAVHLEHVVARNVAALREERGWTQPELAVLMSANGVRWSANRVTQVETLRARMSLLEVLAACWVFEVPVVRLLEGDDAIELPAGGSAPLADLRRALDGSGQQGYRDASAKERVTAEELRRLAGKVGLKPPFLNPLARQMYGRGFIEERDTRAGDVAGLAERSARAKRAHASRALLAEIRAEIEHRGGVAEVERGLHELRIEEFRARAKERQRKIDTGEIT